MQPKSAGECVPCVVAGPALKGAELARRSGDLANGWHVVEEHHLEKEYRFRDFKQALAFTNRVGELAEAAGHHPEINLRWGHVRLTWWTHKSGGLTESDFALAAAADRVHQAPHSSGLDLYSPQS